MAHNPHETAADLLQTARTDARLTEDREDDLPNGGRQIWFEADTEAVAAEYHNDAVVNTNQMGIGVDRMDGAQVAIVVDSPATPDAEPVEESNHEQSINRDRERHMDNRGHTVNHY
jgi:hypothetical protein